MHQNFPDNSMNDLVLGPLNHLWMTCPAGALVNFYNGGWFTHNTLSSGIPTNSLNSLQFDSLTNIWLGTYDRGIVKKKARFTTAGTPRTPTCRTTMSLYLY